jgi:hypothetical protein
LVAFFPLIEDAEISTNFPMLRNITEPFDAGILVALVFGKGVHLERENELA